MARDDIGVVGIETTLDDEHDDDGDGDDAEEYEKIQHCGRTAGETPAKPFIDDSLKVERVDKW